MPNIARPTSNITAFAPENAWLRKSARSSIGSRWLRSSRTNAKRETAATANDPRIRADVQPYSFASISP